MVCWPAASGTVPSSAQFWMLNPALLVVFAGVMSSFMPLVNAPSTRTTSSTNEKALGLVLLENGGGGSSQTWDGKFWVHPLPPEGPVTFVVSWLEHGVAEARAELDGAAIGEAAQRAVTLWPEEPESEPEDGYAWSSNVVTVGEPESPGARAVPDQPGAGEPGDPGAGAEPDQPGAGATGPG